MAFLLKSLGNLVFGQGGEGELIQVKGTFYSYRPAMSLWESIYNDAEAVLKRKEGDSFEATLVIRRVLMEGEAELLDDSESTSMSFQLGIDIFSLNPIDQGNCGEPGVSWRTGNREFMFEMCKGGKHMATALKLAVCRCLWETENGRSGADVPEEDLLAKYCPDGSQKISGSSTVSTPLRSPSVRLPSSPTQMVGNEVIRIEADLYIYGEAENAFVFLERVLASVNSTGDGKTYFDSRLFILKTSGEVLFSQEISNDMYLGYWDGSCTWVYSDSQKVHTFSLKFGNKPDEASLKEVLSHSLFEKNRQVSFAKAVKSQDDAKWVTGGFNMMNKEDDEPLSDFDMMDFREDDEIVEEESDSDDEEIWNGPEYVNPSIPEDKCVKNSLMGVGFASDRSFVARGSQIGVFKPSRDGGIKYCCTSSRLKDKDGHLFSPEKMMLHQRDESLLLLHPHKSNAICRMDLNRGDVVEEWRSSEYHNIDELFPKSKYAQATSESMVLGLNKNGFMHLDPRLAGDKMVDSRSYFYKPSTRADLSCAVTTGDGQLATGSSTGEVRLYGKNILNQAKRDQFQAPRAKTSLPGFGDPVIGIDVTEDGKWVLATCKTYLMVIPTSFSGGLSGFERPMGVNKPCPKRLQLKREHIVMLGGKISFTPAKFNTGQDSERSIVTSSANFVITWNFSKVKRDCLDHYQIKKYQEDIVADQFRFNDDSSIFVATPNNVTLASKVIKPFTPVKGSPFR